MEDGAADDGEEDGGAVLVGEEEEEIEEEEMAVGGGRRRVAPSRLALSRKSIAAAIGAGADREAGLRCQGWRCFSSQLALTLIVKLDCGVEV